MNDIERNNHLAGNSAREWVALAAACMALLCVILACGAAL